MSHREEITHKAVSVAPRKLRCASEGMVYHQAGRDEIELPPGITDNSGKRQTTVGTLSFPVCKGVPLRDNGDIIAQIILRRQPRLLLCAGGSVPSVQSLDAVTEATLQAEIEVLLETRTDGLNYRIESGRRHLMGPQFFEDRKRTNECPDRLTWLERALPEQSFQFFGRASVLLICGEISVMEGRGDPHFHSAAPENLQRAVQAERVLILNPTHTRMGNCGTINAWRRFLSQKGRIYVSASNWDFCGARRQSPTETLHSLWHVGHAQKPIDEGPRSDHCCYREWALPR